MLYKIKEIRRRKKSGRADPGIIGRIVDFDLYEVRRHMSADGSVLIKCVTDCTGVPYPEDQAVSMPLKHITSINWFYGKNVIVVEDREAVYIFDRVSR